jgi:hypothetical protein
MRSDGLNAKPSFSKGRMANRIEPTVAQDIQQAENLCQKSCTMGYAKGCGEAKRLQ